MTFLYGFILLALGLLFTIKTESILRIFGRFFMAESSTILRIFGGSRLFYNIIGVLFIFLGFLFLTGLADNFFLWLFAPLIDITFGN